MAGAENTELMIEKDGTWRYNGQPIVNRAIYLFFNQSLEQTPDGGYQVRVGEEVSPVAVEDTPFVVTQVELREDAGAFVITLNDETEEGLQLETLAVGKDNVLYCAVKGGKFQARFLRPSYYQLTEHLQQDAEDRFYIYLNGKKYYIK
jgi:uncharacterized protein